MRISFCDVDVTFLHSKITTSCKILISHLLHCKTSLVFGDVGLMSHFCVTFVVQNLWGYLGYVCQACASTISTMHYNLMDHCVQHHLAAGYDHYVLTY